MRMSRLHAPTLKQVPRDAEVISHQLLVRGGYIRRVAAGIYDLLPLATRVLRKIETIIREELDRAGAQEVYLPAVQPAELWEESGRWSKYGPELLRLRDRKHADFCVGPTHEEVIVDLVRRDLKSWRALPKNLYQIQVKFRDEIRPRAGLMRAREFLMKDAYSFDADADGANKSYDAMFCAYQRIFGRCGLEFRAVEADTGAIGGSRSHEFQVLAESGEDAIVSCDTCEYAANVEQSEVIPPVFEVGGPSPPAEQVSTPEQRTIEEVSSFLGRPEAAFIKALLVEADEGVYCVLIRGDHDLNEVKLRKLLGAKQVNLADPARVQELTGVTVGFVGPAGLDTSRLEGILADNAIRGQKDAISGANVADAHIVHLDEGRDFGVDRFADLRFAMPGDACPRCQEGKLRGHRGIEVGHVFFLGTKYSEPMRCTFLDEAGAEKPMVMGCYGIGVTRIMAAAIEQNHDEHGICWPASIAPYQVIVLPLQPNLVEVVEAAERLYHELCDARFETLLDDRDERAGTKFNDAELIGIPWRIAVGARGLAEGVVEVKARSGTEIERVAIERVVDYLMKSGR